MPHAQYDYGPFGELLRATGPMARVNPFRFSTKYQDEEIGLVYCGYRYYDPSAGSWLSCDPLGDIGLWETADGETLSILIENSSLDLGELEATLYASARNNPVNNIDIHGLILPDDASPLDERGLLAWLAKKCQKLYKAYKAAKGAKRAADLAKHLQKLKKAKDDLKRLKDQLAKCKGKQAQEELKNRIDDLEKAVRGYEKEIRQKRPDA